MPPIPQSGTLPTASGRYAPAQFAYFLEISRGSAEETKTLLKKGLVARYWDEEEFERLNKLAERGMQAPGALPTVLTVIAS
jgi:four helix bundle protein